MPSKDQFSIQYHADARDAYELLHEEVEAYKETGENFGERVKTVEAPSKEPRKGSTVCSRALNISSDPITFPVGSRRSESRPGDLSGRDGGNLPKGKR